MLADTDPIRGQAEASKAKASRWRTILVWLLRLLSVAWIAKGLAAWTVILGMDGSGARVFEDRLLSAQAIIVYFAVIDLVAGVGLWLTSTWGGVLWMLAACSQLLLGFFFPRLLPVPPTTIALYLGLMMVYFAATWAAEREAG